MMAVGLSGPSSAVPKMGPRQMSPPYFTWLRLSDLQVTAGLWAALVIGVAGLAFGFMGLRRRSAPDPRRLILAGAVAAGLLTVIPPVGSTDLMDYATYGRMAVLGHNPHRMTPLQLRRLGDPVAQRSSTAWRKKPSVYGPVATVTQAAAAGLGGASAGAITFWLKVWSALAFLATALALDRLVGGGRRGRIRAHLLWTVNPLMLWQLIAGGHIDGLAACLAIMAYLLGLRAIRAARAARELPEATEQTGEQGTAQAPGSPSASGTLPAMQPAARVPRMRPAAGVWAPAIAGGMLIGAAIGIKPPFALVGVALVVAAWRSPRVLVAGALGAATVLLPALLLVGSDMAAALSGRGQRSSWISPWRAATQHLSWNPPDWAFSWGVLGVTLVAAAILLRGLPPGAPHLLGIRPAMALCLAWLISTHVYYPWYDAMVIPLLALYPASRLDWIELGRVAVASLAYLPGVVFTLQPEWLGTLTNRGIREVVTPGTLLALSVVLLVWCAFRVFRPSAPAVRRGSGVDTVGAMERA